MAFDIAEYIRKRKSGQTDSRQEEETQEEKRNQQQSGGFDVGEYIRQRKNGNRESTDRASGLRDQVSSWQSGVINTGKQVYDYLSGEGYKSPNEALAAQVDQYLSQGDEFLRMIRTNRGAFGDYKTALKNYANTRKYLEELKSDLEESNAHFSRWKDEEDYQTSLRYYGYQQAHQGKSYDEIIDTLSKMEDGEEKDWLTAYRYEMLKTNDDYDSRSTAGWEKYLADKQAREQAQKDARESESFWDALGRWLGPSGPADNTIPLGNVPEITHTLSADLSYLEPAQNWTDEQKGVFGYLYETDPAAAAAYSHYANESNNQKENKEKVKAITAWATKNGWTETAATIGAIAMMPLSLSDTLSALTEYNARGFISTPAAPMPGQVSNAITGSIATELNKSGTIDARVPIIGGKGWGDAYQLGTSIANSTISAYTQGGLGTYIVFFGSASSSAMYDAKDRGATDEQAIKLGIMSGLAEAAGEAFSVEKLLNLDAKTFKHFFSNVLAQAGVEASEEGVTTLLNNFSEQLVMGDKSNFNVLVNYYMTEKGMTESDAKRSAWLDMANDLAFDMLGGAISGGVSSGVHTGVQSTFVNFTENRRAQQIYGADPGALVGESLEIDPGNAFAQRMQGRLDSGKQLSGRQLNRLVQQNEAAMTAQDMSAIQSAAESRLIELGETGNMGAIAVALAKQAAGEKLTRAEQQMIAGSKYGQRVANELNPESIRSGQYDSAWAENLNTQRINAEEYSRLAETAQLPQETAEITDGKVVAETAKAAQGQRAGTVETDTSSLAAAANDRQVAGKLAETDPAEAFTVDETATAVKQIAKAENGSLVLELENGETVKAEDAVYTSEGEAQIYDAVASLGVNAEIGNSLVGVYREDSGGVAAEDFALGMIDAFQFGQHNIPQSELAQSQFTSKLTPKQRNTAYVLGQTFGGKQVATAEAKARRARMAGLFDKARNADASAKKGSVKGKVQFMEGKQTARKQAVRRKGVVKGYGVKVADINKAFNPSQQQAYKVLTMIADVTGIDIVLFRSVPNKEGKLVGSVIDGIDFRDAQGAFSWHNDKIYIDINAGVQFETSMGDIQKYTMLRTFAHEFTHFIEKHNPEGYNALREMVFEEMTNKGEKVEDLIDENRNLGTDQELSFDEAAREVVAEAMTDILQDSKFVEKLARKQPNMFKELLSKLREFLNRIKEYFDSVTANGTREARLLKEATEVGVHYIESIVQSFDKAAVQAVENYQSGKTAQKNTVPEDAGVKYQIREIGNTGKFYVQADRQVLTGDDASLWGKQIENYINEQIRKEQDIAIPTADGHVLLLTSRSAYKLKDNHVASIQKKVEAVLSDDAYALKGRAATHIDELIQVARFKGYEPDVNQKHENDIGEDGFHYFEAYFRDLDGKYYLVRFSAALNAQEETVYSIGQIRQRSFPADAGSSSKQEALKNGRKASTDIIYTTDQKSQEKKTAILLAYEKALRKKNTDSGTAQNQRRRESLTNRDILAQAEQLVGEQFLTVQHRNVLEIYNGRLDEVKKLELRKREQENKLQKQQSEKTPASEIVKTKNRIKVLADTIDRNLERLKLMEGTQYLKEILTEAQTALEKRQIAESKAKLEEYRSKYGTIPAGEKAVRSDSLPKSTDGINKVSQTARTVKGAGVTTDDFADLIDVEVAGGGLTYLPITNSDTTQKAIEYISEEGWEAARYKWHDDVRAGKASAEMSAIGALLLNNAAKAGDRKVWLEILTDYQIMGTRAAQSVQALRILKTLAPTDKLYMLRRSVTNMVKDLKLEAEVAIDPALEEEFRTAETDEQRDAVITKIQKNVARQLPSTGLEMWTALRYINMLGNFKTQIRNILGNTSMAITNKLKNAIAVGLESLVYKASGGNLKRTKALTVDHDLLVACRNDFAEVEALALDGGKYADAMTSRLEKGIRDQKVIFKAPAAVKNPKVKKVLDVVLKPIEGYRKLTNTAMEKGDLLFSRNAYARALAGYLEANGVKNTDLSKVDENLLDEARAYAIKEAQEVTFRDHNALTEILASKKTGGKWQAVANAIGQGIMPFRQTPANVLLRAEEYSPLGVINTISLLLEAAAGKTNLVNHKGALGKVARAGQNVTGAQIIDSFAKTFTGTGLFVLGMIFANLGWAAGGSDDDEKKKKFDELNGRQNYALVFGDTSWTFDWLAPVAIPFFMGVNLQERITEDGISADSVKEALLSLTEPMLQMSMLQGLNDTLDELRYSDNSLLELGVNALTDYVLQGTTNTLLAQLERSFESSRQATYTDKNEWISTDFQYTLGKTSAKIPGWDYGQIPYINAWGEEEENPPLLANLLYNLLSPGYYSKDTTDAVTMELYRLDKVQDDNVFPSRPGKTYTQDGGEHYLSAEEYVALARTQGQTQRKLLEDMLNSRYYEGLDDGQKAKAIGYVYKYAKEFARGEVIEGYTSAYGCFSSKWMYEIKGDVAEAILRKVATGTTEKYTGLDVDTAAHVTEILQAIKPEAGYTNVRPIQRMETVMGDRTLTAAEKETALREIMPDSLTEKLDSARKIGISAEVFVKAYRKYQDTSGEGKKKTVIGYYAGTFGLSKAKSEELYDLFAGNK